MKSIYDLFEIYLNGKAKTRIYGLFIFWLIVMHFDLVYFALFVNQDILLKSTGLLKNEYILLHYINVSSWQFWITEIIKVLIAALFAFIAIFKLPGWITERSYTKEINDYYKLKSKKIKIDLKLEDQKKDLMDTRLDVLDSEHKVYSKKERLNRSEEQEWDDEYADFKKSQIYELFQDIIKSVFERYGQVSVASVRGFAGFKVDTDMLAYAVSNNLVELVESEGTIKLTRKGNYFVKLYQLDQA